jgi:hypothetical protein
MPTTFTHDHAEMSKRIAEGGSVMLPDGRLVTRVEDLPDPGLLAEGNRLRLEAERNRQQKIADDAQASLKRVNDQIAALPKEAPKEAPKESPKEAPKPTPKSNAPQPAAGPRGE